MTRRAILLALVAAHALGAQPGAPSCPGGRVIADFGYEYISCVGCLAATRVGPLQYTRFLGEPVLHKIRPDGAGANKLVDQDTLVMVGGYAVTTVEAARLLADWQRDSVELVVRRNGPPRHVMIAAEPRCAPPRVAALGVATPPGARLGVAIECAGCRLLPRRDGGARWIYRAPPAIAQVLAGGAGARAGLLAGDTLTAIDGHSILSPEAGARLASIRPGDAMRWSIRRGATARVVTIVPDSDVVRGVTPLPPPRSRWTVDDAVVEATGRNVRGTRDATGALTVRGDSLTVIVRPAPRRP